MLVRFIVVLILLYVLYRVTRGLLNLTGKSRDRFPDRPEPVKGEDLVEDPLCHTHVPVSQAYEATVGGVRLYFCSRECGEKYKADKERN